MLKSLCGKDFRFYQILKSVDQLVYMAVSKSTGYTCVVFNHSNTNGSINNINCWLMSQRLDVIVIISTTKSLKKTLESTKLSVELMQLYVHQRFNKSYLQSNVSTGSLPYLCSCYWASVHTCGFVIIIFFSLWGLLYF